MKEIFIADIRSNCSYKGISTGHFIPVAKMYQALFGENNKVIIAGGPVYSQSFKEDELLKLPFNVSGNSFLDKLKIFANSISLFRSAKGKTIILQQSSDVSTHLSIALFYHGGSKIYLIRYSEAGIDSKIKKIIYKFCRSKIEGIICPNREVGNAYQKPYIVVPDYIYIPSESNNNVPFNQKKYDFCMLGRIAEEKGILEVAERIKGTKYQTIIAGKPQDEELANKLRLICTNSNNIELVLDYITEDQYNYYLCNSKYAVLNYSGEYSVRSSGVVYDTLFSNVPVIGRMCKAFDFISKDNLGYIYKSLDDLFCTTTNARSKCDELLDEKIHEKFLDGIAMYKQIHKDYKKELLAYITK